MIRCAVCSLIVGIAVGGFVSSNQVVGAIVTYDFTGQPGDQLFLSPNSFHPNVTALNLVRGSGLTLSTSLNTFSAAGWNDLSTNDYLTFGFTVDPSYQASLTTLTFASRSSNTGPGSLGLRSSLDGFTANLATWNQVGTADTIVSANLGSLTHLTGNIQFRILALNAISSSGGLVSSAGTYRLGSSGSGSGSLMSLDGNVSAVPEPSTLAMFSLALASVPCIRSRAWIRRPRLCLLARQDSGR